MDTVVALIAIDAGCGAFLVMGSNDERVA